MPEQGNVCYGGSMYRSFRQRGDFITKICSGDNSSCYPTFVEPLRLAYTLQCDTDSGDCCPRAPRHDRD